MKPLVYKAIDFESALAPYLHSRDEEEACTDLLVEAMHFMAFHHLNISSILGRARMHFDFEAAVVTDESVGVAAPECCIPDAGEPSFVLLARDPQAPELVDKWAADREQYEPDSDKPAKARQIAEAMRVYKRSHPDKGLSATADTKAAKERDKATAK